MKTREELESGARDVLTRHFEALNQDDVQAFRRTIVLFDFIDGEPFSRWWRGMRSLAPYTIEIKEVEISERVFRKALAKTIPPHDTIWVDILAQTAQGQRRGKFAVWFLHESKEFLLGCRVHWYLGR